MLTYATLLAAYCDSLKAAGAKASLTELGDYIVIHLPGGFYKCLPTIIGKTIHLDDDVISTIIDNYIDSASHKKRVTASIQNGVGYLPDTLLEFDSSFWHFNNGYSGLSSEQRIRFGNWCSANHIRFALNDGDSEHSYISGTRLCEVKPDNALLHVILLQLSLAAMDLLRRFKEEFPDIPNVVYQIGRLIDIFGVSLDILRFALPTIKGLAKNCGDWSSVDNRSAMFGLCSLLDKVASTTNSAYSVTPEKLQWILSWSLEDKLCLFSDYLKYLRQYASITLVIQSLSYYIVFVDDQTPELKYRAWRKVIEQLGRVAHQLFVRSKYLLESQYGEVINDATDC